ncbi:MAG: ribonuclease III [Actinomycetia bacterium]|nr:ribonuclease III [Actinomycetes bacterium]
MNEPEKSVKAMEKLLGYRFKDGSILFQALCHRSYINEWGLPLLDSNERLEFLGDSVVELAVTHVLYEDFPDYAEGELTKVRASLVQRSALAKAAGRLGLGEYLMLGKGEELTGGRRKSSILADAFEAVVGALYLDGGFSVARGMVISCLEDTIHEIVKWGPGDYKSELQELSVKNSGSIPRYSIRSEGPDHFRTFHAVVKVSGKSFGPVAGTSKKEAEQGAARLAIDSMGWGADRE